MANPYEESARLRKAQRLAAHLHAHGILACELPRIEQKDWVGLAAAIGVNPPKFDAAGHSETVAKVDEILREMEAAKEAACQQAK